MTHEGFLASRAIMSALLEALKYRHGPNQGGTKMMGDHDTIGKFGIPLFNGEPTMLQEYPPMMNLPGGELVKVFNPTPKPRGAQEARELYAGGSRVRAA